MHPILFSYGPLTVYSYGLCVAAAFLAAIVTAAARARHYGWGGEVIYDISIYALVGSLVGARLFYIAENPGEFIGSPGEVFMLWKGGLVYYGGVIGAVAAAFFFLRSRRLSVAECFDICIPSVALGHAIGRIGCFLNGCCFGVRCSLPWAVVFPEGSLAYSFQLYEAGAIPPGSAWSLPVHPVQLYEAIVELGIFLLLVAYFPRKKFHGQIFWMYLLMYGTGRFLLEFLRADNTPVLGVFGGAMSLPQLMSLAMAAPSAAVLLWMRKRGTIKAAGPIGHRGKSSI
jgi:phosphatidylglycerol:prolipoprotein diacylglycerol transferase